jgi:hypothetical protein
LNGVEIAASWLAEPGLVARHLVDRRKVKIAAVLGG